MNFLTNCRCEILWSNYGLSQRKENRIFWTQVMEYKKIKLLYVSIDSGWTCIELSFMNFLIVKP